VKLDVSGIERQKACSMGSEFQPSKSGCGQIEETD